MNPNFLEIFVVFDGMWDDFGLSKCSFSPQPLLVTAASEPPFLYV